MTDLAFTELLPLGPDDTPYRLLTTDGVDSGHAAGHAHKEIATRLSLSPKTVDAHKANAMRKLDLSGRIDIIKYAVLQGWLDTE